MIKLKSNQLGYKLFLALCILGSGIHVHAVESNTETINTFVRPNSVREADRMLMDAARKGDVVRVEQLIQAGNPQVTEQGVQNAFSNAAYAKKVAVMDWLINKVPEGRKVTQRTVDTAFRDAVFSKDKEAMNLLLKEVPTDREVTAKTVQDVFKRAVMDDVNVNIMNLLLKEVTDHRRVTPETVSDLFLGAERHGHKRHDVTKLLLEGVADDRKVTQKDVQNVFNWAMSAVIVNVETINYLIAQDRINRINIGQQVLQKAFNSLVLRVDLDKLAEIHFPKEVYENSEELSHRITGRPWPEEELKTIMAIRTEDGQISSFAEYLLESVEKGKTWLSPEQARRLKGEQHYQDAMALIKLRDREAGGVSRLPKATVFREVLGYVKPRTGVQGGHGNPEDQEESKEQEQAE